MKVYALIQELAQYPADMEVSIEGYRKDDPKQEHNRGYAIAAVDGWQDEDGNKGLYIHAYEKGIFDMPLDQLKEKGPE